eukprot:COSAG06_NODE_64221_length_260_cov_0.639752_2_plen_39_part_01
MSVCARRGLLSLPPSHSGTCPADAGGSLTKGSSVWLQIL